MEKKKTCIMVISFKNLHTQNVQCFFNCKDLLNEISIR